VFENGIFVCLFCHNSFVGFSWFSKIHRIQTLQFLLILIVVISIIIAIYAAVDSEFAANRWLIYTTQTITMLLTAGYSYLQMKSTDEKSKKFIVALPIIQNLGVLILLFYK